MGDAVKMSLSGHRIHYVSFSLPFECVCVYLSVHMDLYSNIILLRILRSRIFFLHNSHSFGLVACDNTLTTSHIYLGRHIILIQSQPYFYLFFDLSS